MSSATPRISLAATALTTAALSLAAGPCAPSAQAPCPEGSTDVDGDCIAWEDGIALTEPTPRGSPAPEVLLFGGSGYVLGGGIGFTSPDPSDLYSFGGGRNEQFNAVAVDSDGSIVAAGFATNRSGSTVTLITRYTRYGSLDLSFGDGKGYVLGSDSGLVGGTYHEIRAIALDSQGRIIVGGYGFDQGTTSLSTSNQKAFIARYLSDGRIDPSFDPSYNGISISDPALLAECAHNGFAASPPNGFLRMASNPSSQLSESIEGIVVDSEDSIYAVGWTGYNTQKHSLALYFASTGVLKKRWQGKSAVAVSDTDDSSRFSGTSGQERFHSAKLDSSGNLLVVGRSEAGSNWTPLVVRFTAELQRLDAAFNSAGYLLPTRQAAYDNYQSVTIDPQGVIVAAGSTGASLSSTLPLLARIASDGSGVTSQVGSSGHEFESGNSESYQAIVNVPGASASDPRFYALGESQGPSSPPPVLPLISAWTLSLALDTSGFGAGNGYLKAVSTTSLGAQVEQYLAAAPMPDGSSIVIAGFSTASSIAASSPLAPRRYPLLLLLSTSGEYPELSTD